MRPILFHIGDFPVHTYGFMGALGFVLATMVVLRRSAALDLNRDHVVDVIFWASIAAIVGSRALFVIQNLEKMNGFWDWINIRNGGLVFYGALLAGLPAGMLMLRRHGLPFLAFLDISATAMPVGHALSRLGCWFAGCCYGTPTDLPWGAVFTHELTDAPHGVALHPTQLYAVGYLALIALVVNLFYARKRFDGQVFALYLALYAVARSVNETFRGDYDRGFLFEDLLGQSISTSQGISILVAIAAIAFFVGGARRARATAD